MPYEKEKCRVSLEEMNHDLEQENLAATEASNDESIYDLVAIDNDYIKDALVNDDRVVNFLSENECLIPSGVTTIEDMLNRDAKDTKALASAYLKLSGLIQDILHESNHDYTDMQVGK